MTELNTENKLDIIATKIRAMQKREETLRKALARIAASKNIKMSEFENQPYNWEIAEAALKDIKE